MPICLWASDARPIPIALREKTTMNLMAPLFCGPACLLHVWGHLQCLKVTLEANYMAQIFFDRPSLRM